MRNKNNKGDFSADITLYSFSLFRTDYAENNYFHFNHAPFCARQHLTEMQTALWTLLNRELIVLHVTIVYCLSLVTYCV